MLAKWGNQRPPLLTYYVLSIQASRSKRLLLIYLRKEGISVATYFPSVLNPHLYLFYIHLQWCDFSETPLFICLLLLFVFFSLDLKILHGRLRNFLFTLYIQSLNTKCKVALLIMIRNLISFFWGGGVSQIKQSTSCVTVSWLINFKFQEPLKPYTYLKIFW